jgi:hypothetical protein
LRNTKIVSSGKEAKRLLASKGIKINGDAVIDDIEASKIALLVSFIIVRTIFLP